MTLGRWFILMHRERKVQFLKHSTKVLFIQVYYTNLRNQYSFHARIIDGAAIIFNKFGLGLVAPREFGELCPVVHMADAILKLN